jgi:putative membrane protein
MSPDTYNWLRVGHILGFVLWIGSMLTVLQLLRVHGAVEGAARDVLARHERKMALMMDLGATLALICGFVTALGGSVNYFKTGAWLHIKVTIVALVLVGAHGWTRAQVRKFRKGQVKPVPAAIMWVVLAAAAAVILLGAHHGLLRKGG